MGGDGNGGAVGVHATGQAGGWNTPYYASSAGGVTDAASGGLAMSGFGIICGGAQSGDSQYSQFLGDGYVTFTHGADLCGGGGMFSGGINDNVVGGSGGIGGGGGTGRCWYNNASYRVGAGGRGGDGIILIQYLPW